MIATVLFVISISTVFSSPQESFSSTPTYSNLPLHLYTVDEAKYRISTAKLTIDIPTRKLVKAFAKSQGLNLDLGRPEHSTVRKVQRALAALVPAESKWERTGISDSSLILYDKVHGMVHELAETLKRWPGNLVDQWALDTIQAFEETIDPVRDDLKKLQEATDELFSKWPNQDLLEQVVELRQKLDPIRLAVKDSHTALLKYMHDVNDLWNNDLMPDSTHQEPVYQALSEIEISVAYYRLPPPRESLIKMIAWVVFYIVIPLGFAGYGLITCFRVCRKMKDAKRSQQEGGATGTTVVTTTQPFDTTPIQWDDDDQV